MKRLAVVAALVLIVQMVATVLAVEDNPRRPGSHTFVFLRTVATESPHMNVDGSITPVEFEYTIPAGDWLDLYGFNLVMIDDLILPTKFGGVPALTNGLLVQVFGADGMVQDFTEEGVFNSIADFGFLTGMSLQIMQGTPTDAFIGQWELQATGASIRLTEGQFVRVTVRDDIRELDHFSIMLQGISR